MNGFEPAGVQETMKRQQENFHLREEKKHEDANIPPADNMTQVPDVRERK